MPLYKITHCCGVGEISGITHSHVTPAEVVFTPATRAGNVRAPSQSQFIFIDVWQTCERPGRYTGKVGGEIVRYILDHDLGQVFSSPWALNGVHPGNGNPDPAKNQHGHFTKTFIWNLNREKYNEWVSSHPDAKRCRKQVQRGW